ncbi:MAG: hypothetical protein MR308_11535 [Lachnospiraceae bacterium]|nr:hypothetical protein [Lachnospiraceae bacterium]
MKRVYEKPMISVEELFLDAPIALTNCEADPEDMNSLMELGYFNPERSCTIVQDEIQWSSTNDTICYHSNVIKAFTS